MPRLCHLDDIQENTSKGFTVDEKSIFAVKKDGELFIYQNQCPHLGINLEWTPDEFLDSDKELIQCSTHGALFAINSGECLSGPCLGEKLLAVDFYINDEKHIQLGQKP